MIEKPKIAFYVREFLSPTMTFVFNRIRGLGRSYRPMVFCRKRLNAGVFPHETVTILPGPGPLVERLHRVISRRVLRRYPVLPPMTCRALAQHLIDQEAGLLHAAFGVDGIEALPAARSAGTPLLVAFAGYDASELLRDSAYCRSLRSLARTMARGITVCEHLKGCLVDAGVPADRVVVIHNGVDLGPFSYRPASPPGSNGTTFIHLSGFTPKKGIEVLVEAFATALRAGLAGRLILGGDGPRRAPAEALARELGVAQEVEFRGYVPPDSRAEFLAAGDIFVHPSLTDERGSQEGIPNTIKEAMAVGLPIVATLHAGIPELVQDGVHGYLTVENDAERLSRALLRITECPERWASMGAAGRKTVEDAFSHKGELRALEKLYGEVLGEG